MKFELTYAALLALGGTVNESNAFTSPLLLRRTTKSAAASLQSSNGGWDNDDFLASLQPPKEGDDEEQRAASGGGGGNEDDVSQGGSRFKAMLEASQKSGGGAMERPARAIPNPFLTPPPPPPTQQLQPTNPNDLSVEDQARMFRELMQKSQTGISADPVPYIAPPPSTKDARGGRPVGRNRDADSIANSADLYFAQLKRDSTVRTAARYRGEVDKAEAIFEDEGINELNQLLRENPYLKGQLEQDKLDMEEVPRAWLEPYMESDEADENAKAYTGIKYKDKLKQMREKKKGGAAASSAPPAAALSAPPPQPAAPVVEAVVAPPPAVPTQPVTPVVTQQAVSAPPPPPAQSVAPAQTTGNSSFSAEDARQNLRTLMGLILKHRGGPGFGKGRLQGDDIALFEQALKEVTVMLKDEAQMEGVLQTTATPQVVPAAATAPAVPQQSLAAPAAAATVAPGGSASAAKVDGIIACIEGATLMYKNSPPEMREGVLITLRSALVSAVNTCNAVIAEQNGEIVNFNANTQAPGGASPSGAAQVDGIIACIEGAVLMYKNSPDELRGGVLATLNGALMTAVYTCNKVIAENELASYNAYNDATGTVPEPAATTPPEFYNVVDAPAEVAVAPAAPVAPVAPVLPATPAAPAQALGTDANSAVLGQIYNDLKNASGAGRLGLNGELTAKEASNLADGIDQMRAVLMDELETGIPDPEPVESTPAAVEPDAAGGSESVSLYQQMLAKAKAGKSS